MATVKDCIDYFACKQKPNGYTADNMLKNAILGKDCPHLNGTIGAEGTGNLERCRFVCTHFTNIEKESDKLKMCELTFKLTEGVFPAMVKFKNKVEYSTRSFDDYASTFTPILPQTYSGYKDIFDTYFQLFTLDSLLLLKKVDKDFYDKLLLPALEHGYPKLKCILLNHKVDSHKQIITKINELLNSKLKNNNARYEVNEKSILHIGHGNKCEEIHNKKIIKKSKNNYLICKKSITIPFTKRKRKTTLGSNNTKSHYFKNIGNTHSNCVKGLCWHKLSRKNKFVYRKKIKILNTPSNTINGGGKTRKFNKKGNKINKTHSKSRKTRKNRKTRKY